jgi:hypothetical protein
MRMNKAQEARAMEGQGRAGRGWHTKTKEYLVAQLDERRFDLRRGYGVEKHHGKRRPSHPRQSSTSAHSMQQHSVRCNRAHAPTRTETPDTRRQCKRSKCLDITSRAPGFCRQSTARARPAVREEGRGPAHAISRHSQAWGKIFVGLNPPVGPRFSHAMVVEGDG